MGGSSFVFEPANAAADPFTPTGTIAAATVQAAIAEAASEAVQKSATARAGQLVDNSGGTTGTNTIAVITGAVDPTAATVAATQNAIATIAARLNAVETIIHNSGLTA